ncbi:P-loop containing nucleoside triphosphate hydrolase protein [Scheffersomyces coipomensis]|uniref:P-loop containing nucleoside triphosphate hydrolase protein n=1 Tax=Scheffersomyces coipomensis TaxID=1788519 RepID=UPI00315D2E2F
MAKPVDTPLEDGNSDLQRQKRMLSMFFSKNIPHLPTDEERKVYPERSSNYLSRMFFWWLSPVMHTGYKRTLEPEDLFKLSEDIKVENMALRFKSIVYQDIEKARKNHIIEKCKARGETFETTPVDRKVDLEDFKMPKLLTVWALLKTFKYQYFGACVFLTINNVGQTTNPLLTKRLIQFVTDRAYGLPENIGVGVGYSFGASLIVFIVGVCINHFFYRSMITGAQAKAVLTKAILDKSFILSDTSRHKYPAGKITSMMGTDLARIDFAIGFQPFLFMFPIPFIIAIAILIVNIGVSALVGIAILFIFMAGIAFSTKKLFAYRAKANKYTDARVNYIKEALNNLKIIKYYSWEPPYHENISQIRKSEMRIIYRMQVLRNIVTRHGYVFNFICFHDCIFTAIFSSISLFNTLTQQVFLVPMALSSGSDAYLALQRVGDFLASEEINVNEIKIEADADKINEMDNDNIAIEVKDASFEWETFGNDEEADEMEEEQAKDNEKEAGKKSSKAITPDSKPDPILRHKDSSTEKELDLSDSSSDDEVIFTGLNDINFTISKGEFIVITGLIGSGKSSLLSAISGFMKRTQGEVNVDGSLLLCGTPWIQNTTVQENITFGMDFDQKKYDDVIYACSLESDLEILPAGDQTEIGERGITLSGGQKARINLARAVYANRDIILMDDVLSAVDARVGKHIMNQCIQDLLKEKTRILATHQLSLIGSADKVLFLNGDGSLDFGTMDELKERNEGFNKLMAYSSESKDDEDEEDAEKEEIIENEDVVELERDNIQRQLTRKSTIIENADDEAVHKDFNKNVAENGKLMDQEERAVNGISFNVYKQYMILGSGAFTPWGLVPIMLTAMILTTFCQLFTNTWLSFWTEYKFENLDNGFYIGFYVMFTVLSFVFLTIEFIIVVYITNTASVTLNVMAVKKVLHAPMSFMDTTPMGRILNRFTKDTDVLDNEIGDQLRFFLFVFCNIIGVIILCIIYLPYFAIAVPFLGFMFVAISNYYQASAREVKRLEAIQRSFVYNNFNETLSGMQTIKAYKAEQRFSSRNSYLIDRMNEAYYLTIANQRWLAIHMDIIACCFALMISLLCVNRVFHISPASVGLLLSYVFQIAGQLSMLIRTFTQVENEMNSVERLNEYAFKLPEEAPYEIPEKTPHPSWPNAGAIQFTDVSLTYRPGLPLVLKDLTFDIKPSEKIGICGRTGAGKSSIMTALYRLSELEQGKITIDDIDISELGLRDLRSKLSIIPQDPVLFKGTIRKNLDPFNQSPDNKLWDALRRTGLVEAARLDAVKQQTRPSDDTDFDPTSIHKFHLDQLVDDEGTNFSLGERQLIAFARALVRDSKILILDEATSSVDYETDSKIQTTIIKEFSQCTILCIAHRLKTILNYDRILVLDKGEIKEFDTPWTLFNAKGSIFQQMCERSSITEDDFKSATKF